MLITTSLTLGLTQAHMAESAKAGTTGQRSAEGTCINLSLLTLSTVIFQLTNKAAITDTN